MAALFLRQVATWRSRQLYEMFSSPPRNHFANGSFHSSTRSQGLNQCSSCAILAQNPSGSSFASLYRRSYSARLLIWDAARNSSEGSKTRCSFRTESMAFDDMAFHSISPIARSEIISTQLALIGDDTLTPSTEPRP